MIPILLASDGGKALRLIPYLPTLIGVGGASILACCLCLSAKCCKATNVLYPRGLKSIIFASR